MPGSRPQRVPGNIPSNRPCQLVSAVALELADSPSAVVIIVSTSPTEWERDSQDERAAQDPYSFSPHPLQAFGHSTLFEKATVELAQLLVQQVVGLVNQADKAVGGLLRRALLYQFRVCPV